jgi:thioesterase domain-containing protein
MSGLVQERRSLRNEALRHLQNIAQLKPRETARYVWTRLRERVADWKERLTFLPLRSEATKNYETKVFPGSLTVFVQGSADKRPLNWQALAQSVEIHQIPPTTHVDVLREPDIQTWAEAVNEKAQRRTAQSQLPSSQDSS